MNKLIKIAHSPDSDDAFMFYAIANRKVDLRGYKFEIDSAEIDKLNQQALNDETAYDIFAVSFHAYAYLADKFQILKPGSSMGGANYGPRVVAKQAVGPKPNFAGMKIAIPGKLTSAYLCLSLYQSKLEGNFEPVFCSFDEVFDLLEQGKVDASLLIHESQLKIQENNLELLLDLGVWWYSKTDAMSMPLGCNVIRRDLGEDMIQEVSEILQESISYGLAHFDDALAYARNYSQNGLDDAKAEEYIHMYVNDQTVSLKDKDIDSIRLMLEEAYSQKLLNLETIPAIDPV